MPVGVPAGDVGSGPGATTALRWAGARSDGPGPTSRSPLARLAATLTRPVLGLTLLAGALRFSTLGGQTYWADESVTVALLHLDLRHLLAAIPATESTPPLYYLVAWVWSKLFGVGEVGLRALSALLGTLTVPVAYAAAERLLSRRAALATAALTALSPMLVWYSQEARSYALLVLLSALTLRFFAEALRRPTRGPLVGWAATAVLAIAAHYFAAFLVAVEAAWLWRVVRPRRLVGLACLPVLAAAAALGPLAAHQSAQGHLGYLRATSLPSRMIGTAKRFVSGETGPLLAHVAGVGLGLVLVAVLLLIVRAGPNERRRALPAVVLAAGSVGLPVLLAAAGHDYVQARNLLPAWLPCAMVVGAGVSAAGARRAARTLGLALCAFSLALCLAVPLVPRLQRPEAMAWMLGLPDTGRVRAALALDYVPADQGRQGAAFCPSDYRAVSGGAAWVTGRPGASGLRAGPAKPAGSGWSAELLGAPRGGRLFQVYAVCSSTR